MKHIASDVLLAHDVIEFFTAIRFPGLLAWACLGNSTCKAAFPSLDLYCRNQMDLELLVVVS